MHKINSTNRLEPAMDEWNLGEARVSRVCNPYCNPRTSCVPRCYPNTHCNPYYHCSPYCNPRH